jgi:hypothetical protein
MVEMLAETMVARMAVTMVDKMVEMTVVLMA